MRPAAPREWRPISEKLPASGFVLGWRPTQIAPEVWASSLLYLSRRPDHSKVMPYKEAAEVTHWMPLPPPPATNT